MPARPVIIGRETLAGVVLAVRIPTQTMPFRAQHAAQEHTAAAGCRIATHATRGELGPYVPLPECRFRLPAMKEDMELVIILRPAAIALKVIITSGPTIATHAQGDTTSRTAAHKHALPHVREHTLLTLVLFGKVPGVASPHTPLAQATEIAFNALSENSQPAYILIVIDKICICRRLLRFADAAWRAIKSDAAAAATI